MNEKLIEFERYGDLTVAQAAKLLDIPRPTYYQYRRGSNVPACVYRQIVVLMRLPDDMFQKLLSEYVYDGL